MKVLVITSYSAAAEPRAVRNAIAARRAFPHAEIIFLDRVARGNSIDDPAGFKENGIKRESLALSTKRSGLFQRAINFSRTSCATWNFQAGGSVREALF